MEHQILTLAIKNNFYKEFIWYQLKGEIYPPMLKDWCERANANTPEKKLAVKARLMVVLENVIQKSKYDVEWFCLCNEEGKPVGFWGASFLKKGYGKCCLEYLLVDESERRKGYAKKLMSSFWRWVNNSGRTKIGLQFGNEPFLRKFYSGYGFKPDETINDPIQSPEGLGLVTWFKDLDEIPKWTDKEFDDNLEKLNLY